MVARASNAKRFDGFQDLMTIDEIAQKCNYTHDQVMLLSLQFVYDLQYLWKMQREYEEEYSANYKRLFPPDKK